MRTSLASRKAELGVSLQSQGFVTGPGTPGIVVQAPQFEGVENIVFPSFVMGVPVTNVDQWNNTLYLSDSISKVIGTHTLKFGGQFHDDQVNEHPNGTFNGTFIINGTETGSAFADFLLGFPSNFTQSTGQHFYLRNQYGAAFAEDSWRVRSNLTLNYRRALGFDRAVVGEVQQYSDGCARRAIRSISQCDCRDSWFPAIPEFLPRYRLRSFTISRRASAWRIRRASRADF